MHNIMHECMCTLYVSVGVYMYYVCNHSPPPQTGSEASVERLMKQIGSFMSEISDEFKTIVVEAIRSVCVKFPRKHHILMNFLSSMLREEGGFEYKKAIVDTIITIIEENPEAKETGVCVCVCHCVCVVRGLSTS